MAMRYTDCFKKMGRVKLSRDIHCSFTKKFFHSNYVPVTMEKKKRINEYMFKTPSYKLCFLFIKKTVVYMDGITCWKDKVDLTRSLKNEGQIMLR